MPVRQITFSDLRLVMVLLLLSLGPTARPSAAFTTVGRATAKDPTSSTATEAPSQQADTADPRGTVAGQTYKNAFLGLEFALPEDLQFEEQPTAQIDPATGLRIISIHAGSKPGNRFAFKKYIVDKAIMFVADPLARHPVDERTDAGYMRSMVRVEKSEGFKQSGDNSVSKIGETPFSRAEFVHGNRHHVVFTTQRKDYAFVFIFVVNDVVTADALAKSMSLKLPQ